MKRTLDGTHAWTLSWDADVGGILGTVYEMRSADDAHAIVQADVAPGSEIVMSPQAPTCPHSTCPASQGRSESTMTDRGLTGPPPATPMCSSPSASTSSN